MRVFVTGATGFIGSAIVPELIGAGHQVIGLARSDTAAAALTAAGAAVQRGSLDDLDSLRTGASIADGVIHCAFIHDFSDFAASVAADYRAIDTFGKVLEGSGRPLVIASGTLGLTPGRVATERDLGAQDSIASPRMASARLAMSFAAHGVRSSAVRLSPTVHGEGDHGFVPQLIAIARARGVSGYLGGGTNRWPAVHRLDAARLFRLALEAAPAGTALHAIAEEGITVRAIAESIGRHLHLPVVPVAPDDASEHFGFLGAFWGMDSPASSAWTRELLGWQPAQAGLLEDLEQGHYFRTPVAATQR
jgi:nucleoside-diphosphate-sugar epimerase